MNVQGQARDLDALYAELPTIECQGYCASSCGPIQMTEPEWKRIRLRLGFTPQAISTTCPMLVRDRCSVYPLRPLICRLWGIVERMPCPWGCEPEPRHLTTRESYLLLARAQMIGAVTEGEIAEARELLERLEAATDEQMSRSESHMVAPVPSMRVTALCECGWGANVHLPVAQWEAGDAPPVVCRNCLTLLGRDRMTA